MNSRLLWFCLFATKVLVLDGAVHVWQIRRLVCTKLRHNRPLLLCWLHHDNVVDHPRSFKVCQNHSRSSKVNSPSDLLYWLGYEMAYVIRGHPRSTKVIPSSILLCWLLEVTQGHPMSSKDKLPSVLLCWLLVGFSRSPKVIQGHSRSAEVIQSHRG